MPVKEQKRERNRPNMITVEMSSDLRTKLDRIVIHRQSATPWNVSAAGVVRMLIEHAYEKIPSEFRNRS